MTQPITSGIQGLDSLVDAIADRIIERMRNGGKRMMRIKEAAAYLGVSRRTFEGLMGSGKIPTVREGSLCLIDRGDLDKWIEMRKARA